jgi:hypothetical protein
MGYHKMICIKKCLSLEPIVFTGRKFEDGKIYDIHVFNTNENGTSYIEIQNDNQFVVIVDFNKHFIPISEWRQEQLNKLFES